MPGPSPRSEAFDPLPYYEGEIPDHIASTTGLPA